MDGMNVLAVREFTKAATDWMRAGNVSNHSGVDRSNNGASRRVHSTNGVGVA